MSTTDTLPTPLDVRRMSHRDDPHTSHEAAERTAKSTKRDLLYKVILGVLRDAPATPSEVLRVYLAGRSDVALFPEADLQDIRRRMTELQRDFGRIEPIQVGTQRNGKPQYATREGQRVMRLTEAVAA